MAAIAAVALAAGAWSLVASAIPPRIVRMATGPEGSELAALGERYRAFLAASGVELRLVPTAGVVENVARLRDRTSGVSVGFALAGFAGDGAGGLESLGTVGYAPLWLFEPSGSAGIAVEGLAGKRIAVGAEGSGTRAVAREVVAILGGRHASAVLLAFEPEEAADRLLRGELDAMALVAGWDAPVVRRLLASPAVRASSFLRADAIVALAPHLGKIVLPRAAADLGEDRPPGDVVLVAARTSLVVRGDLHPALQYLLLQAATRIHGGPGVFHKAGAFPAPEAVDIPLSEEAVRYHTAGRPFLQRVLPFWLWVLAERLLVVLVPLLGVLYPLVRIGPGAYQALMQRRILVLYGELKVIETELDARGPGVGTGDLAARLDALGSRASALRVPLQYAQMLYTLKDHVQLVRGRMGAREQGASSRRA